MDIIGIEQLILLTLSNAALIAWFGWKISRNRIKNLVLGWANEYVFTFLTQIEKNPAIIDRILQPAAKRIIGQYTGGDGAPKDIKIGGFKVPGWIAEKVLGKMVEKGGEKAAQSVFG